MVIGFIGAVKWLGNVRESRLQMVGRGLWGQAIYEYRFWSFIRRANWYPLENALSLSTTYSAPFQFYGTCCGYITLFIRMKTPWTRTDGRTTPHHRPFKWGETRYPAMSESTSLLCLQTFSPYRAMEYSTWFLFNVMGDYYTAGWGILRIWYGLRPTS